MKNPAKTTHPVAQLGSSSEPNTRIEVGEAVKPQEKHGETENINVLIVDDQPANLLGLEAILEGLGPNVVRAHSGHEALRHLLNHDFAVIVLDVFMPEM